MNPGVRGQDAWVGKTVSLILALSSGAWRGRLGGFEAA